MTFAIPASAPRSALASAALLALAATPALAQDPTAAWQRVQYDDTGFRGAGICPVNDNEIGSYVCLVIGCEPGGLGYMRISIAGGNLPDRITAKISNSDHTLAQEEFYRVSGTDDLTYQAALPAEWGMDVVAILQQGNEGGLVIDPDGVAGGPFAHRFTLAGSSAALEPVRACGIRRFVNEPDPLDPAG